MTKSPFAILCLLCPLGLAQTSPFGGPNLLSRGTGTTGQRSGQDVNLKYFLNASAIRDTGLTPYALGSDGKLVTPGALFGVEAGLGGYGRRNFRRSALGLDYSGNFRHYAGASNYDGSNQGLTVEYTHQKSRRMLFDMNLGVGTQSFGTAVGLIPGLDTVLDSTTLLFDNRTSYLQTAMSMHYALSNRTSITMGGNAYTVHRQSSALVGVRGYALQGRLNHQLSRTTVIGVDYQHLHYDFPRAFGETDINSYNGTFSQDIGRWWNLTVGGGVFVSQVQGVQTTALDPAIAQLLGITSVRTIFYKENLLPIGNVALARRFRRAALSGYYGRTITPGNGVYLTSRQENYGVTYSYTGIRKLSMSATAGSSKLKSLGQNLQDYKQRFGGFNVNYTIGGGFSLAGGYSRRFQDFQTSAFPRDSSRTTFSIYFSPGTIPVSLH